MEIVGGSGFNPKKSSIIMIFGKAILSESIGFFKTEDYNLKNNIIEIEKIDSDTKHGIFKKAGWTLLGDLALGGVGTLAGLAFGGKRKQIYVRLKLRDLREVLLTCSDKEYMVLYNLYLNTEKEDLEKEDQQNIDNQLTLDNLIKLKEDGVISEEEYKEKARELMGL